MGFFGGFQRLWIVWVHRSVGVFSALVCFVPHLMIVCQGFESNQKFDLHLFLLRSGLSDLWGFCLGLGFE
jgi:hypothetical protein